MSQEKLTNSDGDKEHEAKAKVLFTAHGYDHSSLNLQGIPGVLDVFTRHLEIHEGKKVLYIESAEDSTEDATERVRRVNSQGFRGVLAPRTHPVVEIRPRIAYLCRY